MSSFLSLSLFSLSSFLSCFRLAEFASDSHDPPTILEIGPDAGGLAYRGKVRADSAKQDPWGKKRNKGESSDKERKKKKKNVHVAWSMCDGWLLAMQPNRRREDPVILPTVRIQHLPYLPRLSGGTRRVLLRGAYSTVPTYLGVSDESRLLFCRGFSRAESEAIDMTDGQ